MRVKNIISIVVFALLMIATGCQRQGSGMELDGECDVLSITLDSLYSGTTDSRHQTITVGVPEDYDVRAMRVTDIRLSAGATADLNTGDMLNLQVARRIRVSNGDAVRDWTMSIQRQQALILSFTLNARFVGIIDEQAHTITVYVPASENIRNMTPTIILSPGATVTPVSGQPLDFTEPVVFTVSNHAAENTYTVTVLPMQSPHVLFVSQAASMSQLPDEEKQACQWLLQHVNKSMYASFEDIRTGAVDISQCKLMWWHFHFDGGVDGKGQFDTKGAEAVKSITYLQRYFSNGGSFLLTRYATYLPGYLAINGAEATLRFPNNCWGGNEQSPETTKDPWFFFANDATHPLYQNLLGDGDASHIFTCDAGYKLTNSTAQWHIGSDWGGYPNVEDMESATGAKALGHGGDGAIVAWEYPRSTTNGGIICIGSGCYDWFSIDGVYSGYHQNMDQMTLNAINYLMNE